MMRLCVTRCIFSITNSYTLIVDAILFIFRNAYQFHCFVCRFPDLDANDPVQC